MSDANNLDPAWQNLSNPQQSSHSDQPQTPPQQPVAQPQHAVQQSPPPVDQTVYQAPRSHPQKHTQPVHPPVVNNPQTPPQTSQMPNPISPQNTPSPGHTQQQTVDEHAYHQPTQAPHQPVAPTPHQTQYQQPVQPAVPQHDVPQQPPTPVEPQQMPVQQPTTVSVGPEHEPIEIGQHETVPMVEVGEIGEMDPEVQEYMERVEKDKLTLNEPIVMHGKPIVQPANWQGQPSMQLPTTKQNVVIGLKRNVSESLRWLATWCVRMIKRFQGRVIYSDAPEAGE